MWAAAGSAGVVDVVSALQESAGGMTERAAIVIIFDNVGAIVILIVPISDPGHVSSIKCRTPFHERCIVGGCRRVGYWYGWAEPAHGVRRKSSACTLLPSIGDTA